MPQNKFELVKGVLPMEISFHDLIKIAPAHLWDKNPDAATAYVLRKCPNLDWNAYLEFNPDVKESGLDACLHFLQHGVYEGRKLIYRHTPVTESNVKAPLLSVVLINYNNAHILPKSLGSVVGQTLKDLEIIVVDDGSTDNSLHVIRAFANADPRIKLIVNPQNSATLITRKRGIEAATGRYLMLLDSDDHMSPDACEIAVREISKGYDMVKFGAHVVNTLSVGTEEIQGCDRWCNAGEARDYFNDEIITIIFRERIMSWHVWSCIYRRDLAQAALAELPDEYITGPDDLYALLAISRRAKSMRKIPDRLFYYNYGPGVSATVELDKLIRYAPARVGAIKAINRFARKNALNINIERLYQDLCTDLLDKFLQISDVNDVSGIFAELSGMLGVEDIIQGLHRRHGKNPDMLANILRPLQPGNTIRNIGIFAPGISHGGMESVILSLCRILRKSNCGLTIFLEDRSSQASKLAELARIEYLGSMAGDEKAFSNRLQNMLAAIRANNIDLMLYFNPQHPATLWDLMSLHFLNLPVLLWQTSSFAESLALENARTRELMDKIFRNADAVICQSDLEELYLRLRGANAVSLAAPVTTRPFRERGEIPPRIALMGRLGEPAKQAGEALKILREIVRKEPSITMVLIGDFKSMEQLNKFRKKARELGVEKHITVTGWTDDPDQYLQECGVFLSVSAWESTALAISEAQANGLPCVVYEFPLEQARDNVSIISVPQGDYKRAASEIIALMENPDRWRQLSRIAVENAAKSAPEKFTRKLGDILNNFQRVMPLKMYSPKDYAALINSAATLCGRKLGETF